MHYPSEEDIEFIKKQQARGAMITSNEKRELTKNKKAKDYSELGNLVFMTSDYGDLGGKQNVILYPSSSPDELQDSMYRELREIVSRACKRGEIGKVNLVPVDPSMEIVFPPSKRRVPARRK